MNSAIFPSRSSQVRVSKRLAFLWIAALLASAVGFAASSSVAAQPEVQTMSSAGTSDIAAGWNHSCVIHTDQTIFCWGDNEHGQTDAPDGQYTAVAAGANYSCAIRTDQTISCWGDNRFGLTDAPDYKFVSVATDSNHACAIRTDQTISCWGEESFGATEAPDGQYTAVAAGPWRTCAIQTDQTISCWGLGSSDDVPDGQYIAIAAGSYNNCAISTDNTISCWGGSLYGEGNSPDGQYTAIDYGGRHYCALQTDGAIACWGDNNYGQADATDGQYTAVAAGANHNCAISTDNTISCWGDNSSGQTDVPNPQTIADARAAERCFSIFKFGAEPVDVAKTADHRAVLAQVRWGYHESIGCFLFLDEAATAVLRAAPAPQEFPPGDPEAAERCFAAFKFGAEPVDVAKTADHRAVLAQVRWGYHESIGCFLFLDAAATAVLRAAHA